MEDNDRGFRVVLAVAVVLLLLFGIWNATHNSSSAEPDDCVPTLSKPC